MLKFFTKNLSWFFLAFLLFLCVWFMVHRNLNRSQQASPLKSFSLTLWLPVQKSINWVITFPENTLNAIRELKNLRQEDNRLQAANQQIHFELSNHKSLIADMARLVTL